MESVKALLQSFKPCYKWITFNTFNIVKFDEVFEGFKPCYKWITFNTMFKNYAEVVSRVEF